MKVVMIASGTDGDIHPMLAIAIELAARGRDVQVLTTEEFVDLFARFGLAAKAFHNASDRQILLAGATKAGRERLAVLIADWCDRITPHIDQSTILVAPPLLSPVARPIRDAKGVPLVTVILAPAFLFSLRNPPLLGSPLADGLGKLPWLLRRPLFRLAEKMVIDRALRVTLAPALRKFGLAPPTRIYSDWMFSPDSVLALFPEWYSQRPTPDDWPAALTYAGFPIFSESSSQAALAPDLEEFLSAGPRPIVFTFGSRKIAQKQYFAAAIAALDRLGKRGIFIARQPAKTLPDLPETIIHVPYVSFELLLPRVSLLVHHGGIGTGAFALAAGTPQLVVPGHVDQFDNGRLLEQLGVGLSLRQFTDIDALSAKLAVLLKDDTVSKACAVWQQRMQPTRISVAAAADEIERAWRVRQPSWRKRNAAADEDPDSVAV